MLARAHSLLGLTALAGYLVYHLLRLWPALGGPRGWIAAHPDPGSRLWIALGVAALLLGHAGLGLMRLRARGPLPPEDPERGLSRLQWGTGLIVLLFVAYHLTRMWADVTADGGAAHVAPYDAYATLWRSLGRPLELAVYVAGVTAVCFHLGHGLSRVPQTFRPGVFEGKPRRRLWARLIAGSLATVLWLGYLQVLGQFALGEPLLRSGGHPLERHMRAAPERDASGSAE